MISINISGLEQVKEITTFVAFSNAVKEETTQKTQVRPVHI